MTNLARLLEDAARDHPEHHAVVLDTHWHTYSEIDAAASRVAHLLASHGIGPGDKVAVSCPNIPAFPTIYFGILKLGATVVPLNTMLKGREVAYHLADSEAVAYFVYPDGPGLATGTEGRKGFAETASCHHLFEIPPLTDGIESWLSGVSGEFRSVDSDDDDTAVILYTSGTTGRPKGAELRHRNLRDNAVAAVELMGTPAAGTLRFLCALPLFHTFAQTCVQNTTFAVAGTVVLLPRFDATAALRIMVDEAITSFAGVPTMYWGLLGALDDTVDTAAIARTLSWASSGGAALPKEIHHQFRAAFGVTIMEGYGLSETSPSVSSAVVGEEPRVGSIGRPIRGVRMRLIDPLIDAVAGQAAGARWSDVPDTLDADGCTAVGEIAVKGHNVLKGYYRRPEATAEAIHDGWFRTGDLARRDADGYYYIVDRSKDMIIRGGYNVYPRELEEVLMEHPAVSLVAVVGESLESHGEEIKAYVVRADGHDDTTEDDLVVWGKEQFAGYKYPRVVEFLDELPMTSTGKILKRGLARPPLPETT